MQTKFSPSQLKDPKIADANAILRACVHCGSCTATCPTYVLLGDERDSPRGRIYMIKEMLEGGKPATRELVTHVDRCLSCLSCMTTCPSGVHYMHLVDHARSHIEQTYRRPFADRLVRNVLAFVLPHPTRFRWAARLGKPFKLFAPLLKVFEETRTMGAMLSLIPRGWLYGAKWAKRVHKAQGGSRRARVVLHPGCAQQVLRPAINDATVSLLTRLGVEVVVPGSAPCCGALVHHMGREHAAADQARRNIDQWIKEKDGEGLDAVIINASGCGSVVKDYGHMLRQDKSYAEKAAEMSVLTRDISEFLSELGLPDNVPAHPLTVAYQSACSLQHGQKVTAEPVDLLTRAGFKVKAIPEGHLCCGSAGTYNILHSGIADRLRDRKLAAIESVAPDVVATGNIGCITQIAGKSKVPVLHTVELLDWATGGPVPAALRKMANRLPAPSDDKSEPKQAEPTA
jgi:glycolate oxidase iron-sulfur subunit